MNNRYKLIIEYDFYGDNRKITLETLEEAKKAYLAIILREDLDFISLTRVWEDNGAEEKIDTYKRWNHLVDLIYDVNKMTESL